MLPENYIFSQSHFLKFPVVATFYPFIISPQIILLIFAYTIYFLLLLTTRNMYIGCRIPM